MEFSCEKKELQAGVSNVERLVTTRSTLPVIGNILFEATKSGLKLSANNLEIGIELTVKAAVAREGAVLLPAKTLSGIVSKLPESAIGFKLGENGGMKISYGQSGFNINSLPPDEFPSLPKVKEGKSFSVEADLLSNMIKRTNFSVSSSEEKYVLTGVLLEVGKGGLAGETTNLRMVATDGYRLAKCGEKIDLKSDLTAGVVIPARALMELVRLIEGAGSETVRVTISSEQISFRCGETYLVSRLIQGQFPDYRQVIPRKSGTRVILDKKEFHRAAERAAVIASGSANVTAFEVKGAKMQISASTPDVGSVVEVIEAEIKGSEKVRASFNVRLITDVLAVLESEKVVIELGEGLVPGVIKPQGSNDYLYIVMPIRTQDVV